ncbi:flagellar assembly protein FlaJ [Bacillus thuringiensis]|uniref:flagellar assembly protein FlaJ n=1 Tax=Bacillus thuringiensis TaxID=1428 RepID=UPI002853FF6E|nr:flagellar assembly protein FlaJ [Bacillus thuringiensis]MDR5021414.1 flagellar assembly protein FlaJ [Bacillus thuringiensis]
MLGEVLREKYLDMYLEYFHLNKKAYRITQWALTLIIFMLYSLGVMITKNYIYFLGLPIAVVAANKYSYFTLVLRNRNANIEKTFLFPEFLGYFLGLLGTSGNIYATLKNTIPYVKGPMQSQLELLVEKIEDNNDRAYYLEFADFVGTSEANMVMSIIYEFSEYGVKKEALQELELFIDKIQENKVNELVDKKVEMMDMYSVPALFLAMAFVAGFAGILFMYYMGQITDSITF